MHKSFLPRKPKINIEGSCPEAYVGTSRPHGNGINFDKYLEAAVADAWEYSRTYVFFFFYFTPPTPAFWLPDARDLFFPDIYTRGVSAREYESKSYGPSFFNFSDAPPFFFYAILCKIDRRNSNLISPRKSTDEIDVSCQRKRKRSVALEMTFFFSFLFACAAPKGEVFSFFQSLVDTKRKLLIRRASNNEAHLCRVHTHLKVSWARSLHF